MVAGGGDRDDRHGGQGGVHGDQRDNSPAPERQTQDGDQGQTGRASVLHIGGVVEPEPVKTHRLRAVLHKLI